MIKKFALISPLFIFCLSSFDFDTSQLLDRFEFNKAFYGPFDGSEEEMEMDFNYRYNGIMHFKKVYEIAEYRYNGMSYARSYTDYHDLEPKDRIYGSITFYPGLFNNFNNFDITFRIITDETYEVLYNTSLTVYKKTPMIMEPFLDGKTIYTSVNNIFCIPRGETKNEIFNFSKIDDSFPNKEYYELDISNQIITYDCSKTFTYKNAYLCFYDSMNIFNGFRKDSSGLVKFPLSITQNGKTLSFAFSGEQYVNPHTLIMNTKKTKNATVKTSRVYLPVGKKDELEGQIFFIRILEAGVNKSTIEYNLTYYSTNNLFGYCHNSDYCVKGGNAN